MTASQPITSEVLTALQELANRPGRVLLGLVGAPASGKSTLARILSQVLPQPVGLVPMDGFHLSQRQLERLGRSQRKGAPDTFDSRGYQYLLARLRQTHETGETVYAPDFNRQIEEPIAAGIAIEPDMPLVITEGNYLLLDEKPWPAIAAQLDVVWFLDVEDAQRENWLLERHQYFGLSRTQARAWVSQTDRPNAQRIKPTASRADRLLGWTDQGIAFLD